MPILDKDQVRHLAHLVRLELTEEELATYQWQIDGILRHLEVIKKADVEGLPPTMRVAPLKNVWHEDLPGPSLPREEALGNAERRDAAFFLMQAVLGGEEEGA